LSSIKKNQSSELSADELEFSVGVDQSSLPVSSTQFSSDGENTISRNLSRFLNLDEDQARFLSTYEEKYGRDALANKLKKSISWSEMKPYPDLKTNPDPT
jgi:hypothetical protein